MLFWIHLFMVFLLTCAKHCLKLHVKSLNTLKTKTKKKQKKISVVSNRQKMYVMTNDSIPREQPIHSCQDGTFE